MWEWILKYWLEVLFVALFGYVIRVWKSQNAIKNGIQAILRDRLIQAYNYHMEKGYCAIHDRDSICNMYAQYHHLGANGVIDNLMEEFNDLPVKKPIEKQRGD